MRTIINTNALEDLYTRYNRREFVHPDPLEFLYNYDNTRDRETAGLIASSLAYGRVAQILKNVTQVLNTMGPSPFQYVHKGTDRQFNRDFKNFKYRFTTAGEFLAMLRGARAVMREYGSLEQCLAQFIAESGGALAGALPGFAAALNMEGCGHSSLMPRPECGSACKRLNLYLRWMVRRDDVDPGGWRMIAPGQLVIPLDTHMHRLCTAMGLTRRKSADMRTALEITNAFRKACPDDPVKYDFCITRLGIRGDTDPEAFIREYHAQGAA